MDVELITGMILGDGHIEKGGQLACEHSIKQADYLYWKYDQLADICLSMPRITKNGIRFRTKAIFKDLRELWYGTGRKALPEKFESMLTAKVLAVWFMDDGNVMSSQVINGYYCSNTRMRLSACCFNREEHRRILDILNSCFGINAEYKREGKYLRIQIPATNGNSKKFADLIRPFIPDCMRYKLPMFRIDRRGQHGNQYMNRTYYRKPEGVETEREAA